MSEPTMSERFTNLADAVSEGMGKWWVSVIALVLVLIWLAVGPFMHFSDSWQLIANSPTTIAELFIGFFLAAATNRVERRHDELLEAIKNLSKADLHKTERMEMDMETIKRMLAKIVVEGG